MRIVFMGTPAFALPALQSLMSNKYDISAVITQPDRKTGRGQQLIACPVKRYAVEQGLRVIQPETFSDQNEVSNIREIAPDLIVVAAYGQILPGAILEIPRYKCINIHPSLLPKYRGPSPVAAAILNGDDKTGVTIMLVEKKVDSGPVLGKRELAIVDEDTTGTLTEKLAEVGGELLIDVIQGWVSGKLNPEIQDESQATYTKMETKEDGRIDWKLPALKIWRMVRAYHPWPGCFTTWNNTRLGIIRTVPVQDEFDGSPGRVIALPRHYASRVAIKTGDGLLGLLTVQQEGKKEMSASDFVAGHRNFIGSVL